MTARRQFPFVLAALAAAMSWFTVWSWRELVEDPQRFLEPALLGAVLIAATGAGLRAVRLPWWAVLPLQVVVVTSWIHHRQHADDLLGGWLPTLDGLEVLADQVRAGASQINRFAAPVSTENVQAPFYLLVTSLVVVLVVDLISCGLRRAPWSGLPVLVALTVPISVLDTPLDWPVLALAALLYCAVLAYSQSEELLAWGHGTPVRREDDAAGRLFSVGSAGTIGVVTTLAALVLPAFVPVHAGLLDGGSGEGPGRGSGTVTLTNPLVDLRRDLQRDAQIPLVDATTDDQDPSYLRLTVLNRFNGSAWTPSSRQLPPENRAVGELPLPAGITSRARSPESSWRLTTTDAFVTTWLPTPYPIRDISVREGDWRYDRSTLDIASTDRFPPTGVAYSLTSFRPEIDPADLASAGPADPDLQLEMTAVPDLDPVVTSTARSVTAGADSDYAKAVRLQDWFRNDGGFSYSLDQRPGSGMSQLARFITVDKFGYCEQFAAAMAVMARALRIPARVVVGFLQPGQISPGSFRYTSSDLHAWPEIYFAGSGWVRFEPTPSSRTGTPPPWTVEESEAPAPVTATPTPTRAVPTTTAAPQQLDDTVATNRSSSPAPVVIGVLLTLAAVLLLALPGLVRRSQRARRLTARADGRAEVEDLLQELRATAIDLRVPWRDGRSVRSLARMLRAAAPASRPDTELLEGFVDLVERARYQRTFTLEEHDRTLGRTAVARWSALLNDASTSRTARSAQWFPRSVRNRSTGDPAVATSGDRSADLTEVGGRRSAQ